MSPSHRQPNWGAFPTESAENKHLITACRDTLETQKKGEIWLILRILTLVACQVILKFRAFTSQGDNRADVLCRLAMITDGISVRVRKCVISELRLCQTPVAVWRTRVFTSQTDVSNRGHVQNPTTMDKQFEKSILFCTQTLIYQTLQQSCSLLPLHLYWILRLSYCFSIWWRFLIVSERGWQEVLVHVVKAITHLCVSNLKYNLDRSHWLPWSVSAETMRVQQEWVQQC